MGLKHGLSSADAPSTLPSSAHVRRTSVHHIRDIHIDQSVLHCLEKDPAVQLGAGPSQLIQPTSWAQLYIPLRHSTVGFQVSVENENRFAELPSALRRARHEELEGGSGKAKDSTIHGPGSFPRESPSTGFDLVSTRSNHGDLQTQCLAPRCANQDIPCVPDDDPQIRLHEAATLSIK